jgi:hypothetical protein
MTCTMCSMRLAVCSAEWIHHCSCMQDSGNNADQASRAHASMMVCVGEWCCLDKCMGYLACDGVPGESTAPGTTEALTVQQEGCRAEGIQLLLDLSRRVWASSGRMEQVREVIMQPDTPSQEHDYEDGGHVHGQHCQERGCH